MAADTLPVARRLPRAEFEAATHLVSSAESRSRDLLSEAERAAERVKAEADAHLARIAEEVAAAERRLTEIRALQEAAERDASQAAGTIDNASGILRAFDDAVPWVTGLVGDCVRRIIGDLASEDVLAATVAQGMRALKFENGLILRCAEDEHAAVAAQVDAAPDRFAAVERVQPDAALAPGELRLEGRGGFVDIGIEAQLDRLLRSMAISPAEGAR